MPRLRISLANKVQILFSVAVGLILFAALLVPWFRMEKLVEEGQRQTASRLADAWLNDVIQLGGVVNTTANPKVGQPMREGELRVSYLDKEVFEQNAPKEEVIAQAITYFRKWVTQKDLFRSTKDSREQNVYTYARAIRMADIKPPKDGNVKDVQINPITGILFIEMQASWASEQLTINIIYLAIAGILAVVLAIACFWFITTRVILSPVRVLRETTEKVSAGDLTIRADINTGDEFEQLSKAFNTMLVNLKQSQDQLRELNRQLDIKLGELEETNISLHEANRLKGDFLANVSHELRTPLNSIMGFAEILVENFEHSGEAVDDKRLRYSKNILGSSQSLMQLITELLDLAKIEAGRIDLHIDQMSVQDLTKSLIALMKPQADEREIKIKYEIEGEIPFVMTDPLKFRQILFNFLSNAVKFTPDQGLILVKVSLVVSEEGDPTAVKVSVKDNGPGIGPEDHEAIFEKFTQLDSTHTRRHSGTGLGLAISRELSHLLRGKIDLESDVGKGSTFSITIPIILEERAEPLMPELKES